MQMEQKNKWYCILKYKYNDGRKRAVITEAIAERLPPDLKIEIIDYTVHMKWYENKNDAINDYMGVKQKND